ncbi:MAG: hypothetical protein R3E79_53885 [Caldilineaceae bacterium]
MPMFRTIFYLPSQTPLVATAFLWNWIYHPDFGLANAAPSARSAYRHRTGYLTYN